ncbi:MAG: hypothetical protein FJ096_09285 [Deltaproteobacteria bacterium]|nr:hypothetical protein [Deltaproteobacteria bacterium]
MTAVRLTAATRRAWVGLFALCFVLLAPFARAQEGDGEQGGSEEARDSDSDRSAKGGKAPVEDPRIKKAEPVAAPAGNSTAAHETNCADRIDEDGDSVIDCADSDCLDKPECRKTGVHEQTDALCSDFIDNDGDGTIDCDDKDCQTTGLTACRGSWKGEVPGVHGKVGNTFSLPPIDEGMNVDQLIGKFGDSDGERNDYTCSDGVDNDSDGKVDCADFGCRFDPQVTICNAQAGLKFSVVAQIKQLYRIEDTNRARQNLNDLDTSFSALQMRFLGPIGNIENSFFLLNMRAEKTPRLTFAMFQLPVGKRGHFFNINSGGGGLTAQTILSISKHPLIEPAYFVFSAFEQGNGAATEFGGPIDEKGRVNFRVFAGGGAGNSNGNVGGRFFADDNTNYTWTVGGQFHFNLAGYYNRFDTPFIYNAVPLTAAALVGAKYDQRAQERYPAWNGTAIFKWWHFYAQGETYWKRELEFGSWQYSYLATIGALLWPRHLYAAADFGEYIAGDLDRLPADINADVGAALKRQRDERQFRAALHWYAYEQTGLVTLRYKYDDVKNGRFAADGFKNQELSLTATYRF